MGGPLGAQSEAGSGIELPVHPAVTGGRPAACRPAPTGVLADLRALLVDAHPIHRRVVAGQLGALEVRYESAGDADSAIAVLPGAPRDGDPYRVVVVSESDRIDATALAARIEGDRVLGRVPAVLLTAMGRLGRTGRPGNGPG